MFQSDYIKYTSMFVFMIGMYSIGIRSFIDSRQASPIHIAHELQRQGVDHWEVVTAQAIIESGWKINSSVFKETGNFCGMRVAGQRPSTRNGRSNRGGYASFIHWKDCVRDIKYWQQQNWKGGDREAYYYALDRWAEDTTYFNMIRSIIARIDHNPQFRISYNSQNRFKFAPTNRKL